MTAGEAYGGARLCVACAREEREPEDRATWLTKAKAWRDLARWLRDRNKNRRAAA